MQQLKQPSIIVDQYPEDRGEEYFDEEDLPGYDEYKQGEGENGEMQTLFVYTYDPEEPFFRLPRFNKHQLIAALMGLLALAMLVGACFIPSGQVYTITTISVQAHFTSQQFNAVIAIVPTGKKEYPATKAKGTLVIYNGSFLAQQLPANLMVTASNGVTFATDYAVTVPGENTADNPPSNGIATVTAHAVEAGSQGNVQAGAINAVYGSSLFIKNLAAFSNGREAYTQTYATNQDKQNALDAARQELTMKKWIGLQAQPCTETTTQTALNLTVTLSCRYVEYHLPPDMQASQVVNVRVQGDKVILKIRIVARVVVSHFAK